MWVWEIYNLIIYFFSDLNKWNSKIGPEAGQYFHVQLTLRMGYETREEYMWKPQQHKRNLIRIVPF